MLNNDKITEEKLQQVLYDKCASKVKGKCLVVCGDSSSLVFNGHCRITDATGLRAITQNKYSEQQGLMLHSNLVFDRQNGRCLGISQTQYIERRCGVNVGLEKKRKTVHLPIEKKESNKWLEGFEKSKEILNEAEHIVFVGDRECDIQEIYDRVPDEKCDVVIRSHHDRVLVGVDEERVKFSTLLAASPVRGTIRIEVGTKNRKKRRAILELRWISVTIPWKDYKVTTKRINENGVQARVLEVREKRHKGFSGKPPLHWRIITSLEIETKQDAEEVVALYQSRWRIEEHFKLLKSDCFNIESCQPTTVKRIRKLLLFTMDASIKIERLKAARSGETEEKLDDLFSKREIEIIQTINGQLEGRTEKQKNPYAKQSLAYGAWTIARLGGWKGFYHKNRPPGSKTFAKGLKKLNTLCIFKFGDVS